MSPDREISPLQAVASALALVGVSAGALILVGFVARAVVYLVAFGWNW